MANRSRPNRPGQVLDSVFIGDARNNKFSAHEGNDTLDGGAGDDWLSGGPGADLMTGGPGADTFHYKSNNGSLPGTPDTITDFTSGVDHIHLDFRGPKILVGVKGAIDLTPTYIGSNPFSLTEGEIRLDNQQLQIDLNADGVVDMLINVLGVAEMSQGDFLYAK